MRIVRVDDDTPQAISMFDADLRTEDRDEGLWPE
jgi:hypothetical protein